MSLRYFHLFFITLTVVLCWIAAWWFLFANDAGNLILNLFFGLCLIVISIGLIGYEIYFFNKMKKFSEN